MLLLMLTILMFQLQSFQRVVLVLSVAPLGVIGVVAALLMAQAPLGFVAMLGVLALVGMIARNSVILIDQIEHERAAGNHPWDAVVTAAIHRTRPILLTASAATLGMIPIAPTRVLGADGVRDHRRANRGDRADADLPAGPVCRLVPDQGTGSSRDRRFRPRTVFCMPDLLTWKEMVMPNKRFSAEQIESMPVWLQYPIMRAAILATVVAVVVGFAMPASAEERQVTHLEATRLK